MGGLWKRRDDRAGIAMLALFALLLQLAVPQGFMLARDAGQPTIAICTGHGPLLAPSPAPGLPGKAPKPGGVCAFAGHGGAPTPIAPLTLVAVHFEPTEALGPTRVSTSPGRGLAAPPPPSQGPPARLL